MPSSILIAASLAAFVSVIGPAHTHLFLPSSYHPGLPASVILAGSTVTAIQTTSTSTQFAGQATFGQTTSTLLNFESTVSVGFGSPSITSKPSSTALIVPTSLHPIPINPPNAYTNSSISTGLESLSSPANPPPTPFSTDATTQSTGSGSGFLSFATSIPGGVNFTFAPNITLPPPVEPPIDPPTTLSPENIIKISAGAAVLILTIERAVAWSLKRRRARRLGAHPPNDPEHAGESFELMKTVNQVAQLAGEVADAM